MLSANVSGDANARHQIRHRARHGLRGGVASPLQRFAPVVPALTRLPCGTRTASTLDAGLCAGSVPTLTRSGLPWCRAPRDFRDLPQAFSSSRKSGPEARIRIVWIPHLSSKAFGRVSDIFPAVASSSEGSKPFGRRRNTADRRLQILPARARKTQAVSVLLHGLMESELYPPATLWTPATCRVCRLCGLRKRTPHVAPERRPNAVTETVPSFRRFPDQLPTHRPGWSHGLMAFKGKSAVKSRMPSS
jgi:hypothetical protein